MTNTLEFMAFCTGMLVSLIFICFIALAIYGAYLLLREFLFWILRSNEKDARRKGIKIGSLCLILITSFGCTSSREAASMAAHKDTRDTKDKTIPHCIYNTPYCIVNHSWSSIYYSACQTNITRCLTE